MAEPSSIEKYRLYSFVNMYLSDKQKGIQTTHVTSQMTVKWKNFDEHTYVFGVWAEEDKTVIMLNGGYSSNLRAIYKTCKKFSKEYDNFLPYVKFHESEDALDGALTAVGIILPADVYDFAAALRKGLVNTDSCSKAEVDFYTMLNSCPLA